ncbi:MAG: RHS repeat-associated core domain-containing protein, partial [Bacteroidota bacterium]
NIDGIVDGELLVNSGGAISGHITGSNVIEVDWYDPDDIRLGTGFNFSFNAQKEGVYRVTGRLNDLCSETNIYQTFNFTVEFRYVTPNEAHIIAYDPSGVVSEAYNYFSLDGRPLQSQTKNLTENKILAVQTVQDLKGREILATLPAPINGTNFSYDPNFIQNQQLNPYGYKDFDLPSNRYNPGAVDNSRQGSLGWYYSDNNTWEDNVPVTNYPYSRSEYYEDGSEEPKRQAGPGEVLRLGAGHEITRSTFPVTRELDHYLQVKNQFFNSGPTTLASEAAQEVMIDENGVAILSISDANGNVLMEAIAEEGTDIIAEVIEGEDESFSFYFYQLDNGNYRISDNPIVFGTAQIELYDIANDILLYSGAVSGAPSTLSKGFYQCRVTSGGASIEVANEIGTISYNFYDNLNRLVASIPPNGVMEILENGLEGYNEKEDLPFIELYEYNHAGWLLSSTEPDAGRSEFMYRKDGSVRFSQDALQRGKGVFTYTNYDRSNRPVESGEYVGSAYDYDYLSLSPILELTASQIDWVEEDKKDWVRTNYDSPDEGLYSQTGLNSDIYTQDFLMGAVSSTENKNITTWYSYDEFGRVIWMAQKPKALDRTFLLEYEYDFLGNVITIAQKTFASDGGVLLDQFYHHYTYDADKRLSTVSISTDGNVNYAELQARYVYYLHGPLKRIELAEDLQKIDFTYTIEGWLKSINDPHANPGQGDSGFRDDVFSMTLNYYESEFPGLFPTAALVPQHDPLKHHGLDELYKPKTDWARLYNPTRPVITAHGATLATQPIYGMAGQLPAKQTTSNDQILLASADSQIENLKKYIGKVPVTEKPAEVDKLSYGNGNVVASPTKEGNRLNGHGYSNQNQLTSNQSIDALLTPVPVASQPLYQVYLNFGANNTAASPWNNTLSNPVANLSFNNLNDDSGNGSGINLTLQTAWGGLGGTFTDGAVTGNNSGVYPDNVIEEYYFFGVFGGPEQVSMKLDGLNGNYTYDITFFSSSIWPGPPSDPVADNGHTIYKIGMLTDSLAVQGNGNNTVTMSGILPDANGEIVIDLEKGANTRVGYLNAMVITVHDQAIAAPTTLTAQNNGQVQLQWADNANNETGYSIERRTIGGLYNQVTTVASNTTSWTDASALPGAVYQYRVRAYDALDYSLYSNETTISLASTGPVSSKLLINFNYAQAGPSPWNNTQRNPAINQVFAGLQDTTGTATGIDMTFLTGWGGAFNDGAVTGNDSGVYPDAVMDEYYYFGIFGGPEQVDIRIDNLDPTKIYDFTFFGSSVWGGTGSNPVSDNGETVYTIGNISLPLHVQNNTGNTVTIPGIVPNAQGQVTISMTKGAGAQVGYINAMVLEERIAIDQGQVPDAIELAVLRNVYDSLGGDGWTNKTGWPNSLAEWPNNATNLDFAGWSGVTVQNGDISALTITQNPVGEIPESIGQLKSLKTLAVRGEGVIGDLPVSLGGLTSLTQLNITNTSISGTIPSSLNSLNNLFLLYLDHNNLTGQIPDLSGMNGLFVLALEGNQLTGFTDNSALPSNLTAIYLEENQLSGAIPEQVLNTTSLGQLHLNDNNLTGPIPQAITNLTSLVRLDLANNNLEGDLPSAMNNLPLEYIDLSINELTGTIPYFGSTGAAYFNFSSNRFDSLADYSDQPSAWRLSLIVDDNYLGFGDIEQNLTGSGSSNLNTFEYADQKQLPQEREDISPSVSNVILINDLEGGENTLYQWQELTGGIWTDIPGATQSDYELGEVTIADNGRIFRVKMTNDWVTGEIIYGPEIELLVHDTPLDENYRATPLYNGTITAMSWQTDEVFQVENSEAKGIYMFEYDEKYQLTNAVWANPDFASRTWAMDGNKYRVTGLAYDPNGNIQSLRRYKAPEELLHSFKYDYLESGTLNNQLQSVSGYVSHYGYDAIGQMTSEVKTDGTEQHVDYDVSGKVIAVYSDAGKTQLKVTFEYDDRGFRLMKKNHETGLETWYFRDAVGSIMSMYEKEDGMNLEPVQKEIPIYGSGKLGMYYPDENGAINYELTDHLGNVRAILRKEKVEYLATMETSNAAIEEALFDNIAETRASAAPTSNHTPGTPAEPNPNKVARLNGFTGDIIGPAKSLAVNPGDKVEMEVFVKYLETQEIEGEYTSTVGSVLNALAGAFGGVNGGSTEQQAIFDIFDNALGAASSFVPEEYTEVYGYDRPKAYLNYLFFDENFVFQYGGYQPVTDQAAVVIGEPDTNPHQRLALDVDIEQKGYIYIYVATESADDVETLFDDFKVTHSLNLLAQSTDYYPFGSVAREEKADDTKQYRFGYQGEFAEKDEETGWNSFELRQLDPVIARWLSVDPERQYPSPYVSMGNSPVQGIDPDGARCETCPLTKEYDKYREDARHYAWSPLVGGDGTYQMLPELTIIDPFFIQRSIWQAQDDVWNHPVMQGTVLVMGGFIGAEAILLARLGTAAKAGVNGLRIRKSIQTVSKGLDIIPKNKLTKLVGGVDDLGKGADDLADFKSNLPNVFKGIDDIHLNAAIGDLAGKPIVKYGKVWDHLDDISSHMRGLNRKIKRLNKLIDKGKFS